MNTSRRLLALLQGAFFLTAVFFFACGATDAQAASTALTPGDTYTVTLSKMNSDGTVTDVDSTTAVADDNGKLSFSFSGVPTSPDTNFLVLTIRDQSDIVVRKSFVPAPPDGDTGELGANSLSTVQTNMILTALQDAGTDDPIVAAYGLILTRTPDLTDQQIQSIATVGRLCIQDGFENMLLNNGVTATQLQTLKEKLIYNQPNKDLSNFTTLFKNAVDDPSQAQDDMGKAAGLIGDIFIDAAQAAGVDLSLILAAHDAAGDVFENNTTALAAETYLAGMTTVIDSSMSNFGMRIQAVKFKTSYTDAFAALNASGADVTRFNSAVQTMVSDMQALDKQYQPYYQDSSLMTPTVANQMQQDYSAVFSTFQSAIAANTTEITAMRSAVATALGLTVGDLPSGLGTDETWDYNTAQMVTTNWPIPKVVATDWVAGILSAGGALTYDRSTVANQMQIPGNMSGGRTDFSGQGLPPSFAALMGMQEDISIAENTRDYIWDSSNSATGGNPNATQKQDALLAFANNVALITNSLSGTIDGVTAITAAQKAALVRMAEHPDFN